MNLTRRWVYTHTGGRDTASPTRPDIDTLRKQIAHARIEKGIASNKDIARRAGINPNTFDNLFKQGRKQSLYADDLWMVSRVLERPMEELLTGEKPDAGPAFEDPIKDEMVSMIEKLDHEQARELRAVMRTYMIQFMGQKGEPNAHSA